MTSNVDTKCTIVTYTMNIFYCFETHAINHHLQHLDFVFNKHPQHVQNIQTLKPIS